MPGKPALRARFIETSKKALEDPTLSPNARLLHEAVVRAEGKVMNVMGVDSVKGDVDPREWALPGLPLEKLDIEALIPYQTELESGDVDGEGQKGLHERTAAGRDEVRAGSDGRGGRSPVHRPCSGSGSVAHSGERLEEDQP